jgi:hypothetical protein
LYTDYQAELIQPNLGPLTRDIFSQSYCLVFLGRPLWREVGSVICQSSSLQSTIVSHYLHWLFTTNGLPQLSSNLTHSSTNLFLCWEEGRVSIHMNKWSTHYKGRRRINRWNSTFWIVRRIRPCNLSNHAHKMVRFKCKMTFTKDPTQNRTTCLQFRPNNCLSASLVGNTTRKRNISLLLSYIHSQIVRTCVSTANSNRVYYSESPYSSFKMKIKLILVWIKTRLSKVGLPNDRLACVLQVLLRTSRNYILLFYSSSLLFLPLSFSLHFLFFSFMRQAIFQKWKYDLAFMFKHYMQAVISETEELRSAKSTDLSNRTHKRVIQMCICNPKSCD